MISVAELDVTPIRQGHTLTCIPASYATEVGALIRRPGQGILFEIASARGNHAGDLTAALQLIERGWESSTLGVNAAGSGYDKLEQVHVSGIAILPERRALSCTRAPNVADVTEQLKTERSLAVHDRIQILASGAEARPCVASQKSEFPAVE